MDRDDVARGYMQNQSTNRPTHIPASDVPQGSIRASTVHIESVRLVGGKLEVIKRKESHMNLLTNPPQKAPDKIWKEVYKSEDGEIVLEKTVSGKHVPARWEPERFEFEDESSSQ